MNKMIEYYLSEGGVDGLVYSFVINLVLALISTSVMGLFVDNGFLSVKAASKGVWKTEREVFLEKKTPAPTNLQEIEEKQKVVAVSIAEMSEKTGQLSETKDRLTLLENQVQWLILENAKLGIRLKQP